MPRYAFMAPLDTFPDVRFCLEADGVAVLSASTNDDILSVELDAEVSMPDLVLIPDPASATIPDSEPDPLGA